MWFYQGFCVVEINYLEFSLEREVKMEQKNVAPDIVECPNGFLAVSPRSFKYRIGVTSPTREGAVQQWHRSLEEWMRLSTGLKDDR